MVERRKHISPLVYWATERENIRRKKEAREPAPWTADPILQRYRFCNVRRRDDRVSRWLIGNVFPRALTMTTPAFIQLVALCRWINWPPTIKKILESEYVGTSLIDLPAIGKTIDCLVVDDVKAWTGAYMVRAPSKKKYPGMSKGTFVCEVVVEALDDVRDMLKDVVSAIRPSAEKTFCVLQTVPNYGSFMAGQIVADLTYTPLLDKAYDLNTWAPQGPGSKRGFNRLLGRPLRAKITPEEWSERLQGWREEVVVAIGSELNLHDLQNVLCELDKYLRVKRGEGRPRSTYKPETAF